jgi:hypothetical protein
MEGVNYLLVTLAAGERWTYRPPAGHTVGWLGALEVFVVHARQPVADGLFGDVSHGCAAAL